MDQNTGIRTNKRINWEGDHQGTQTTSSIGIIGGLSGGPLKRQNKGSKFKKVTKGYKVT